MADTGDKIEVRNVNGPNHVTRVDRAKYDAIDACAARRLAP